MLDSELLGGGRGQEDHVFACFQGPQINRSLLVALFFFAPAALFGCRLRFPDDEQSNRRHAAPPNANRELRGSGPFDTSAEPANIDRLSVERDGRQGHPVPPDPKISSLYTPR